MGGAPENPFPTEKATTFLDAFAKYEAKTLCTINIANGAIRAGDAVVIPGEKKERRVLQVTHVLEPCGVSAVFVHVSSKPTEDD